MAHFSDKILQSRAALMADLPSLKRAEEAAEGGCGVLGFAANLPVAGRHVLAASRQMHNRGNGKGGGIAMVGLDPAQVRVDLQTLRTHYLLQIALLEPKVRPAIEARFIEPFFDVAQAYELEHVDDYRQVAGLEVRPPDVWRYFVRPKPAALADFAARAGLAGLPARALEDEFVYQNSFRLNQQFYASLGEKQAFVLSHGRNLSVLKIVGYAEQVVEYYRLEDHTAHVWIAHQRYPTKGRVWHPGGAHPFIGLNEALVHNGDFANYHAVSEYLHQRNIGQLFLTDTEVSVQLFDLWDRVYGYPLEITLEAMAPTSEYDFSMLAPEKQSLYQAVQRTHIHGSPDGPWFFIVARSIPARSETPVEAGDRFDLLGITDTSMLRPQVFALYENEGVQIGLIASERQAINACLRSLSAQDPRFQPTADQYWAARGGSHTDGGSFRFAVKVDPAAPYQGALECTNKFGAPIIPDRTRRHLDPRQLDPQRAPHEFRQEWERQTLHAYDDGGVPTFWNWLAPQMANINWDAFAWGLGRLGVFARSGAGEWHFSLGTLNLLHDWRYDTGSKKRASLLRLVDDALLNLFESAPRLPSNTSSTDHPSNLEEIFRLGWEDRGLLSERSLLPSPQAVLLLDAFHFPPEGDEAVARYIARAAQLGWRNVIVYNWRGGRFAGSGLGAESFGVRLDCYGDVGDYTASGLDGAEVHIHGAGQDQLGQIIKQGKLVIHGDAGQTFLYGAKGGDIFVLGSVAGRPLINAVGRPRAVINGTCLDYLAESFMAGDPLNGGGFVILNGMAYDDAGQLRELESPYPGGNLFSLASGGAIYLRDPHQRVTAEQLNGGTFAPLSAADWDLIEPYLQENQRLFGIRIQDLLSVAGSPCPPHQVYRKVTVRGASVLSDAENR